MCKVWDSVLLRGTKPRTFCLRWHKIAQERAGEKGKGKKKSVEDENSARKQGLIRSRHLFFTFPGFEKERIYMCVMQGESCYGVSRHKTRDRINNNNG